MKTVSSHVAGNFLTYFVFFLSYSISDVISQCQKTSYFIKNKGSFSSGGLGGPRSRSHPGESLLAGKKRLQNPEQASGIRWPQGIFKDRANRFVLQTRDPLAQEWLNPYVGT